MRKSRVGMFETNSSSAHVLTLADNVSYNQNIIPDDDGVIEIVGYTDFGWGIEEYTDPLTKAEYLFMYLSAFDCDLVVEQPVETLIKVIKQHTGAKRVIFTASDGYIDHNSSCENNHIWESEESIKNFLFNSRSVLEITNDNI